MDEKDYAEMFGIDPEELNPAGEEEPETAAPEASGEEEPETAEPEEQIEEPDEEPSERQPQTREERARNAAERRKREMESAIEKARQEEREAAKEKMNEFFKQAGLKDPTKGNKPITSMEEFEAYRKAYDEQQIERTLQSGRLNRETLDRIVEQNPVVQQARQVIEQANREREQAEKTKQQEQMERELAQIQKLDPSITSVEDILKMPTGQEFYAAVQRGNNLYDAYRLANFEAITTRQQEAALQQQHNRAASKQHLQSTPRRSSATVEVPKDELQMFRELMPEAKEADIRKYYNDYLASRKK